MDGREQINGQTSENRVNLAAVEFVEKLHELNAIQSAISNSSGEVAAAYDEIETFVGIRLDRIRTARKSMRDRQKHSRRIANKLAELLQVLGD
jgi:hypothetical protein